MSGCEEQGWRHGGCALQGAKMRTKLLEEENFGKRTFVWRQTPGEIWFRKKSCNLQKQYDYLGKIQICELSAVTVHQNLTICDVVGENRHSNYC